ncbi:MAG: 23S rRNA (uracil(1939)-C(5))-methyltransferase RlmD [Glaciimonas sp.]|nr:23S rRNA (uracil(1939)-C(5))-methyltransferase RlmD [Glaciimonas sp.]
MSLNMIEIESLDMDGRGVGHLQNEDGSVGKVVFVEGALPGEHVGYQTYRKKAHWEAATMIAINRESALRVKPKCDYFGLCGGCAIQHLEPSAQVAVKQRVLEDNLWHIGRVRAETILRPIYGPTWGYRYRARLSVNCVPKKGGVLVGFHEKKSRYITDMETCEILPPHVSKMLVPLRHLIATLSIVRQLPQIELAVTENITAMVLRIMAPLTVADEIKLKAFADAHAVHWWLQPNGLETAAPFYPENTTLHYSLPEFGVKMPFKPTDFTQVNHHINRVMVTRALRLLDAQASDRVADLFCGLGNFTLPIATQAREVIGIEGSSALTERALENAQANGLAQKTQFLCRNLFEATTHDFIALGKFDRLLIDPPRDGAIAVCQALVGLRHSHSDMMPKRIVYVSCSPSTLARDAGLLVQEGGYTLKYAGVVNMFPHTAHVESMAVFDLNT